MAATPASVVVAAAVLAGATAAVAAAVEDTAADRRSFLSRKWAKELDYRLIKELWAFTGDRIAVRFAYKWHDDSGNWFRSYGNENGEFDARGLMRQRIASINDLPITPEDRKYHWIAAGPRPAGHPGLNDFGL